MEKLPYYETILYPFVTEHHINLLLILNPRFNSSICCQLLVLSIRPQHHLETDIY